MKRIYNDQQNGQPPMSMRDELHVCFGKEMGRRNAAGAGTQITEINSSQNRMASILEGVDSATRKSPSPFGKSNSIRVVKSPKMSEKKDLNICRTQDNSLIGESAFTITPQPCQEKPVPQFQSATVLNLPYTD